jgi:hypothetical protein
MDDLAFSPEGADSFSIKGHVQTRGVAQGDFQLPPGGPDRFFLGFQEHLKFGLVIRLHPDPGLFFGLNS